MRKLSTRIFVAFFTFYIGITACVIWLAVHSEIIHRHSMKTYSSSPSKNKISESEAVRLAEHFVIKNGYTAFAPMEDKSKIKKEWTDDVSIEKTLKFRYDTIISKAYGVKNEGERGWSVVFRYNFRNPSIARHSTKRLEHLKTVGRVVIMDSDGKKPAIEHEDFELDMFQPVKEGSNK